MAGKGLHVPQTTLHALLTEGRAHFPASALRGQSSASGNPLQSCWSAAPLPGVVAAAVVGAGHVLQRSLQLVCNSGPATSFVQSSATKNEHSAGSSSPLHVGASTVDVGVVVGVVVVVEVEVEVVVEVEVEVVAMHEPHNEGHSSRNLGPLIAWLQRSVAIGHSSASNAPLHCGRVVVVRVAVTVVFVPVVVVVVDVVHVLHKAGHCCRTSLAKRAFLQVASVNRLQSSGSSLPLHVGTNTVVVGALVVGEVVAVVVGEVVTVVVASVVVAGASVVSTHVVHNNGQTNRSLLPTSGCMHRAASAGHSSGSNAPLHFGSSVVVVSVVVVEVVVQASQRAGHAFVTSGPKITSEHFEAEKSAHNSGSRKPEQCGFVVVDVAVVEVAVTVVLVPVVVVAVVSVTVVPVAVDVEVVAVDVLVKEVVVVSVVVVTGNVVSSCVVVTASVVDSTVVRLVGAAVPCTLVRLKSFEVLALPSATPRSDSPRHFTAAGSLLLT